MSLGRGHQRGPRSTFFICLELNELEEFTRESTVARLGRDGKKLAEITGPRSPMWAEVIGPRSPWAEVTCIPIHLNTYIMDLRPLQIFSHLLSAGIVFRRQNLEYHF